MDQRYSDNDCIDRGVPSFIEPLPPLVTNPFMRPRPQKGTNLLELFEKDSDSEEADLVQVYLRLKPCSNRSKLYVVKSNKHLLTTFDTTTVGHGRKTQDCVPKLHSFSHIFGSESNQKEIFELVVKENLKKLPEGHSYTLLTYGASGSGKTYTLMGTVTAPGLVPRSLEYVFRVVDAASRPLYRPSDMGADKLTFSMQEYELQRVKDIRKVAVPMRDKYRRMSNQLCNDMSASTLNLASRTRHYVWVSFVEVYNEKLNDLLVLSGKRNVSNLKIREDPNGNVFVQGATQVFVRSGQEAYDVMVAGKLNLQVAATGVHAHSSRSHSIFTITMLTETESGVVASHVRLCDLAGCERARDTRNVGARMQESRSINSSLHVLERCLHVLRKRGARGNTLVPYRESKLTRILGAGLSGSRGEAVSMVVTVNPAPDHLAETKHVLQLAGVAKDITLNQTMLCTEMTFDTTTTSSVDTSLEIMSLKTENERLHFELAQAKSHIQDLEAGQLRKHQESANLFQELFNEAKDMSREYYEHRLETLGNEIKELKEENDELISRLEDEEQTTNTLYARIALLEEELAALRLSNTCDDNQDTESLLTCIEEGDEKEVEPVVLISDSESDEETDVHDPCNESLEPTFSKEELNRSRQRMSIICNFRNNENTLETISDDVETDSSQLEAPATVKKNYFIEKGESHASVDCEDSNNDSESNEMVQNGSNDINHDNAEVESPVTLKKNSMPRDAYFAKDISENNDIDSEPNHVSKDPEQTFCQTESAISSSENTSIIKSAIHGNDNSLTVFEQLEMAANHFQCDKKNMSEDRFSILNRFKEKRKYFDDEVKEDDAEGVVTITDSMSVNEMTEMETVKNKEYIDDKPKNVNDTINKDLTEVTRDSIILTHEKNCNIETISKEVTEFNTQIQELHTHNTKSSESVEMSNDEENGTSQGTNDLNYENIDITTKINKKKKTYFDNIVVDDDNSKKAKEFSNDINVPTQDFNRSPSIVQEDSLNEFEPNSVKKYLSKTCTKNPVPGNKLKLLSRHDSLDMFEGLDSPLMANKIGIDKDKNVDIEKSNSIIDEAIVQEQCESNHKKTVLESETIVKDQSKSKNTNIELKSIKMSNPEILDLNDTSNTELESNSTISKTNNTTDDFEDIYKNLSVPRTTEFELLLSYDASKMQDMGLSNKELSEHEKSSKYNLRTKKTDVHPELSKKKDKKVVVEEVLAESHSKCEKEMGTKRSLRLRRRKNQSDDVEDSDKLKDIFNLQMEFSDVTLDVPVKKEQDLVIASPEEIVGEEENLPPSELLSCPSKSVTRSRRKLFTPRVEPLEESEGPTGDSSERVRVPRPSYHRGKARRKLN